MFHRMDKAKIRVIGKDGKPAANTVGFQPKENLLEFIKSSMQ